MTRRLETEHEQQAHIAARRELHAIAQTLAYFQTVDEMAPALRWFFPELTGQLTPKELDAIAALATSRKPLDL